MLETLIEARGFRKSALRYDSMATFNRVAVTGNMNELQELNRDQLIMALIACGDEPGSLNWQYVESRFGPLITHKE